MRYWWVNQNQTYRAEVRGNFMWSPRQNANGVRNQFYENMRAVRPGDDPRDVGDFGGLIRFCLDKRTERWALLG